MRAVLLGTDYVKDIDGSFKALETNTNIALGVDTITHLDTGSFQQFISDGGFTKINLIASLSNLQIFEWGVMEETQMDFNYYLKFYCSGSGIDYSFVKIDDGAVSIPDIEDSETTLTIRIAYDTTALIDSEYSGDNWGFLKLMNDDNPNSIPKTYINDSELGFDSIGTTIRDNGVHPNYCVKKRITPSDNNIYPIFHKVNTVEELQNLKDSLEVDEYLQEYIYNPTDLLYGKLKHYRSVDFVYGSELDSFNLWISEVSNIKELVETPDYDNNNVVQIWDRVCYTNKYNSTTNKIGIKFSADDTTNFISENGDIITVNEINVNDSIKSINLHDLPMDLPHTQTYLWSSSYDGEFSNYSVSSSVLNVKNTKDYFGHLIYMETQNGMKSSDVPHASILVKLENESGTFVTFCNYEDLKEGDTIFLFDLEENRFIEDSIVSLTYGFDKITAYTLDFEELDVFLTLEETENRSRYSLLTHNYDYDCAEFYCDNGGIGGNRCGDNVIFGGCFSNYAVNLCLRYGGSAPVVFFCAGLVPSIWGGTECQFFAPANFSTYCNSSKSDRNLKEDITYLYTTDSGLKIYSFKFKEEFVKSYKDFNYSGEWSGVIAQDLLETEFSNCVRMDSDGHYSVDYKKLGVTFKKLK